MKKLTRIDTSKGYIQFENVVFSYPSSRLRTPVLNSFSFEVKPNEVVKLHEHRAAERQRVYICCKNFTK